MIRVLSVIGTRPEVIKMAPVIRELRRHADSIQSRVCVTAQHREMLYPLMERLGLSADHDLEVMRPGQTLSELTARVVTAIAEVLAEEKPQCVLIQGDTTTVLATALAAFYEQIPVGHVEAGLRTGNPYSPFPEEMNRKLVSSIATLHFAPTQRAVDALLREQVRPSSIFLTGNTVVDSLHWIVAQPPSKETVRLFEDLGLQTANGGGRRLILVTAHRRESFGEPFVSLCTGLRNLADRNPDVLLVYPVHMNPRVRATVQPILAGHERIRLLEPLPYEQFALLTRQADLVLTDSGGVQEEAPVFGKPVLVLREDTERPEAVEAGTVKVIGTNADRIVFEAERLLHDRAEYQKMASAVSPYGDGHAAERIVSAILQRFAGRP